MLRDKRNIENESNNNGEDKRLEDVFICIVLEFGMLNDVGPTEVEKRKQN
jgi:hypothetical protein